MEKFILTKYEKNVKYPQINKKNARTTSIQSIIITPTIRINKQPQKHR